MTVCSHKSKSFSFPREFTSQEGQLCKILHLVIAVDDSEEKMVFITKVKNNIQDKNPKMITYLTSIAKTLQKVFNTGSPKFSEEVIYLSNIAVQEGPSDFNLKQAFFHKDFGLFMNLSSKKKSAEKSTYLFYLPRTSLFTGKDLNQLFFKFIDFHT